MQIDRRKVAEALTFCRELGLVSGREADEALGIFEPGFLYADALSLADTIHLHVKVDDTDRLPRARILEGALRAENEKKGYVKFPFAGGCNMIFSSINVAEDDLVPDARPPAKPFLDHVGIDMRREEAAVRGVFEALPGRAREHGWRHASQGGPGRPVFCCHTQVNEKHWLYPPQQGAALSRPLEFAYGPLQINAVSGGCDLRPMDPADPAKARVPKCGARHEEAHEGAAGTGAGTGGARSTYYDPKDLARFGEVGKHAAPAMEKFWAYYESATGTDGALCKREKGLIALAVAHALKCPYCIDAYTGQCLERGATPEQMHEAIHVAAAMAAGITLVHGVQMQAAGRALGKM